MHSKTNLCSEAGIIAALMRMLHWQHSYIYHQNLTKTCPGTFFLFLQELDENVEYVEEEDEFDLNAKPSTAKTGELTLVCLKSKLWILALQLQHYEVVALV